MRTIKRFSVVALLLVSAMALTGCLSHWFTDSTTRLQIENKTSRVFVGLDIVSEDGSSVIPWIQDSLPPGERSRVFESDWVGTFNVKLKFMNARTFLSVNPATDTLEFKGDFEFVGGSVYLVLTDNEDFSVHMEMR